MSSKVQSVALCGCEPVKSVLTATEHINSSTLVIIVRFV